jgi:sulfide:quinone oxidoreductase
MTRVLIAGSGVAAIECVLALRAVAGPRVDIELLSPAAELVLRPTSVETPFGGPQAPRIALDDLGVRLRRDVLAVVEPEHHRVLTRDGEAVPYELLVIATGARSQTAVPGAATFRGPLTPGAVEQAIDRLTADPGLRLAVVAPPGAHWLLPLYELALLSAATLRERGVADPDIVVATPEHAPLEALGAAAGEAVRAALDGAGIDLITSATAVAAFDGAVQLTGGALLDADVAIALPELVGPRIAGLPHDDDGYLPIDEHGRVPGVADVYAAGDATAFPIKHGGLAAQQADAVADAIGARVGAVGHPEPFRPVVRALLLTGGDPLYLLAELPGAATVSTEPLWSPPGKIGGRYIAEFLSSLARSDTAYSVDLGDRDPASSRRS